MKVPTLVRTMSSKRIADFIPNLQASDISVALKWVFCPAALSPYTWLSLLYQTHTASAR